MIETSGSYLGRYQAGDLVPLRLWVIDRDTDGPALPDEAPWLRVRKLGGGSVDLIQRMPTEDFYGVTGLFRYPLRLHTAYTPGTYVVVYSFRVNNHLYMVRDQFQVIPGSDGSGTVISMFYYRHPETNYVLAQLTGGYLVLGRNPKV